MSRPSSSKIVRQGNKRLREASKEQEERPVDENLGGNETTDSEHEEQRALSFWRDIYGHVKKVGSYDLAKAKKKQLEPKQLEGLFLLYKVVCKAYKKTAEKKMVLLKWREAFGDKESWHIKEGKCLKGLNVGLKLVEQELQQYDEFTVNEGVMEEGNHDHDMDIPVECLDSEVMAMDWSPIRDVSFTLGRIMSIGVYEYDTCSETVNEMFVVGYNILKDFCEKILQE